MRKAYLHERELQTREPEKQKDIGKFAAEGNSTDIALKTAGDSKDKTEDLTEEIDSDELAILLDIMGMDDADEVMPNIPVKEDDEDSEDSQELLAYSHKFASGRTTYRPRREEKKMEVEVKRKFRRLVKSCRYCGRLYSFRTDQPEPTTCGMAQCIAKYEESNKGKSLVK